MKRVAFKVDIRNGSLKRLVEYILTGFSGVVILEEGPYYLTYSIVDQPPYFFIEKNLYCMSIAGIRNLEILKSTPLCEYALAPQSLLSGGYTRTEERYRPEGIHRGHLSVRKLSRELAEDELNANYYVIELNDPLPLLSLFRGISRFDVAWARVVASYKLAEIISSADYVSEDLRGKVAASLAAIIFDLLAKLPMGIVLSHYWSQYAYAMWLRDVRELIGWFKSIAIHRNRSLLRYLISKDAYMECLNASKNLVDRFTEAARALRRESLDAFCDKIRQALSNLNDGLIPLCKAMSFLLKAVEIDCNYVKSVLSSLSESHEVVSVYGVTERSSPLPFAILEAVLRERGSRVSVLLTYTVNTYDRLLLISHFFSKRSRHHNITIEALPVSAWNVYATYTSLRDLLAEHFRDCDIVAYSKTTNPATVLYALLKLKFRDGKRVRLMTTNELLR